MGLGLLLRAPCRPGTTLHEVVVGLQDRFVPKPDHVSGHDREPPRAASVVVHPGAEPLRVSMAPGDVAVFEAKTSTLGPGFHAWLVEQLERWATHASARFEPAPDDDPTRGDETGWFTRRDRAVLEAAFLEWLQSMAKSVVKWLDGANTNVKLCLPTEAPDVAGFDTLTPLGPRDRAYWQRVADDPSRGRDFFPWWDAGTGADFHLGRALGRMWSDVRWRPPLTDAERHLDRAVLDDLAAARALDPARAYPWREWAELAAHLGTPDPAIAARAAKVAAPLPLVGYRRGPIGAHPFVRVTVPIPGAFAERFDDGTWHAFDGSRDVWLSSYTGPTSAKPRKPTLAVDPSLARDARGVVGWAGFKTSARDGVTSTLLQGELFARGKDASHLLVVTMAFREPALRDWAIDTWKRLELRA